MKDLFNVFARIGLFGFGGPVATIAMMEEEVCRKRRWISPEKFSEIYSICKILPGPVATQMAIYLGSLHKGLRGGLLSGALFILPAFLMVLGLSYFYVHTAVVKDFSFVLKGMQTGALVVILFSTLQLASPYRHQLKAWVIALSSAFIVSLSPGWEPLVILCWGLCGAFIGARRGSGQGFDFWPSCLGIFLLVLLFLPLSGFCDASLSRQNNSILFQLFWTCFKAGAFVFGTGLAVVPVLEGEVVQHFHWLTHAEFMDGISLGQVTPGPFVITATFIGYKTAGLLGALAATLGIFLPAFVNVLWLVPRIWSRVSGTRFAQGFSSWAIPAVIGGIIGTSIPLGRYVLSSPQSLAIFIIGLGAAFFLKLPGWLLILLAGAAGAAIHFL